MTPCLRSTRLILHPYTPILVTQRHVDWLNDKELMRYSEQRLRPHTMVTQLAYASENSPTRHVWLIRCLGQDIGTISVHLDENNLTANLGILLAPEAQGNGFAAEAWCAVIDWLFETGTEKVACGTRGDNGRMRRLALTTGMRPEGEIPGHFKIGDTRESLALYGRFRDDEYHSVWQKMWSEPFYKPRQP